MFFSRHKRCKGRSEWMGGGRGRWLMDERTEEGGSAYRLLGPTHSLVRLTNAYTTPPRLNQSIVPVPAAGARPRQVREAPQRLLRAGRAGEAASTPPATVLVSGGNGVIPSYGGRGGGKTWPTTMIR